MSEVISRKPIFVIGIPFDENSGDAKFEIS